MDYQLARSLKDAGFHQNEAELSVYLLPDGTFDDSRVRGDGAYVPILEQLIDECEREGWFDFKLEHHRDCWSTSIVENTSTLSYNAATVLKTGSTPAEAVARLWLALNNNQKNV